MKFKIVNKAISGIDFKDLNIGDTFIFNNNNGVYVKTDEAFDDTDRFMFARGDFIYSNAIYYDYDTGKRRTVMFCEEDRAETVESELIIKQTS